MKKKKYISIKTLHRVTQQWKQFPKLDELGCKLLLLPPYFTDLAASDPIFAIQELSTKEEVIAKSEVYFVKLERNYVSSNLTKKMLK